MVTIYTKPGCPHCMGAKEYYRAKGIAFDVIGKLFAAVDRADTRSWQTLPAEIAFYRMECPPGRHTVQIRYFGEGGEPVGASSKVEFEMRDDPKSVVYLP